VTALLAAFQGYLGYNVIGGQFGIESQKQMTGEIEDLQARSASLKAEIDAYRHRVDLFKADKLDPDILTERARALLNMAHADDLVVMVDPATGLPQLGSTPGLASNDLSALITGSVQ
jgi:cell division protein FtsB